MRRRERAGIREYVGVGTAIFGLAGSLALAGCSTAASRSTSRPAATASQSPSGYPEGCIELTVTAVSASPKTGTNYELGVSGLWGSGVEIEGEQFTFVREKPDPHGPGSYTKTPIIKIDQGVLPSIMHEFPPTTTPETVLVEGAIITTGGKALPGQDRCEVPITVVPVSEFQGPQLPIVPA